MCPIKGRIQEIIGKGVQTKQKGYLFFSMSIVLLIGILEVFMSLILLFSRSVEISEVLFPSNFMRVTGTEKYPEFEFSF